MKAASYANALLDNMFRNSVADALGLALIESDSEQYLLNSLRQSIEGGRKKVAVSTLPRSPSDIKKSEHVHELGKFCG